MTQAIKRTYMNYLDREKKYEKRNKKNKTEQSAAKGLLAPRTARATNNTNVKADDFQPVFDAIQMIRNRGS